MNARHASAKDIVQEITTIIRDVANGVPPGRPDALDDDMPGG
jgi:hypothetical protein